MTCQSIDLRMMATERGEGQYVFSSAPSVPREKTPDVLVRFQAVTRERPCLLSCSVYLSSNSTLVEVRKAVHKVFAPCYEKGFIFLRQNKEVVRSRERLLRLFDILPKSPIGVDNSLFKYPNVQYKKLSYEKNGRRYSSVVCGLVYLYEDSGLSHWVPESLQMELSAPAFVGFDYIPWSITSARSGPEDVSVDRINELAAMGREKELVRVLSLLPSGLECRQLKDSRSSTPLHYAAQNGHVDICEILIGRLGRDMLYMKDVCKRTPLHCVLTYGKFEDPGFEWRKEREDGRLCDKFDVVSYLLQLGPDLMCQDVHGLSCHRILFGLGHKALDEIIDRTDLSILDDTVILHLTCYALQLRKLDIARKLCGIVKVFDPTFYRPPLHVAAEVGDREIVELLIRKPDLKTESEDDQTDTKETEPKGYDPTEKDTEGHLPFHYACQHGCESVLPLLYFDEMSDEDFSKGAYLALQWNRRKVLMTIYELRDIFFLDDETKQLCIQEIERMYPVDAEYARSLIKAFKVEPKLLVRFTSQAARVGDLLSLEWLLERDVDLSIPDAMGRVPMHEAAQMGHDDCLMFLLKHTSNPNHPDWRGSTPLHYACSAGNADSASILLRHEDTIPNVKDTCGRTPLLVAAHRQQRAVIKTLTENFLDLVDPFAVDNHHKTILNYLHLMDLDTVSLLLTKLKLIPAPKAEACLNKKVSPFVDVCELWRDQRLKMTEKKRLLLKKKLRAARMKCKKCGRVWTVLGDRIRLRHVCKSDEPQTEHPSQDDHSKPGKKSKTAVKSGAKEDCEEIASLERPFQRFGNDTDPEEPVLRELLLRDNTDILELVTQHCSDLIGEEGMSSAMFSAFHWHPRSLQVLVMCLGSSQSLLNTLLHVACLQKPNDTSTVERQMETVNYLLKEGASPNHIPEPTDGYKLLRISVLQEHILFYSPLELAVIHRNKSLVEMLITEGASSAICLAVHLAAASGDSDVLEYLLKKRKEEGDSIIGTIANINELCRVFSLGMGLLQAVCSSSMVSRKLVDVILKHVPEVVNSKKLLTRNMVSEVRPSLDLSSRHSLLRPFLFRTSDTSSSLPLTWLMASVKKCPEQTGIVLELLRKGLHLGEVRVSKTGSVHNACVMFTAAVDNKQWAIAEAVLQYGGEVLWGCLMSKHNSCQKHVYSPEDKEDTNNYPIIFQTWSSFFRTAPLSTARRFFQEGFSHVGDEQSENLKKKISPLLSESDTKEEQQQHHHILTQIVSHHIYNLDPSRSSVLASVKLVITFPKLFHQVFSKLSSCQHLTQWMSVVPRDEFARTYNTHKKAHRTVDLLRDLTIDRKLQFDLLRSGVSTLRNITNSKSTLLHVASVINDVDLLKVLMDSRDPVNVAAEDDHGGTCLDHAAALGNEAAVDYLLKTGASATQQTLLAVCVGVKYVPFMGWRYTQSQGADEDETMLKRLKVLCSKLELDVGYRHPLFGNVLKVSVEHGHWKLVQFILENGKNISQSVLCERSVIVNLMAKAPLNVCTLVLEDHKEALAFSSLDVLKEVLMAASRRTVEPVALLLLQHILKTSATLAEPHQQHLHDLLSYTDFHGKTALHHSCGHGNVDFVRFALKELGVHGYLRVNELVNVEDASKVTALWYALANRHWRTAEVMLIHGGQLKGIRSVPDLWPRRQFSIVSEWTEELSLRKCQDSLLKANDSTRVAEMVSPGSKIFKQIYTNIQNATQKKSHLHEHWVPRVIAVDQHKKRIQYLLGLVHYAQSKSLNILHAAAAVGDVELLQELVSMSTFQSMVIEDSSPIICSLANYHYQVCEILFRKITSVPDSMQNILALTILDAAGFPLWPGKRKKDKVTFQEQLYKDAMEVFERDIDSLTIYRKVKHFLLCEATLAEEAVPLLLKSVLKYRVSHVSDTLLLALAYLGNLESVKAIWETMKDPKIQFRRTLLSVYSFPDLICAFVKCPTSADDVHERTRVLEYIGVQMDLKFHRNIIDVVVKTRHHSMLTVMLRDGALNTEDQASIDSFINVLYDSSVRGVLDLVRVLTQYPKTTTEMLHKALCLACMHRSTQVVEYLLEYNPGLMERVKDERLLKKGRWLLDFAILGGSCEVVQKVLGALEQAGVIENTAVRDSMELSAKHGSDEVLEVLLNYKSITNPLGKDFVEKLLLMSAERGAEKYCLRLLRSRYLDVRRTDKHGNSLLHYSCLWGMTELAEAVLKASKEEVKLLNSYGQNPLDLSRSMGNVAMSNMLVNKYRAIPSQTSGPVFTGWMKHFMTKNASSPSQSHSIWPSKKLKKSRLTLVSQLKSSNDLAALAMLEVSHETIITATTDACIDQHLFHLCAVYGCVQSLKYLLTVAKEHAADRLEGWLNVTPTPLLRAIEKKHVDCVELLVDDSTFSDLTKVNENILHVAAKAGIHSVVELLASKVPEELFSAKDESGLTPATTAVAFGHHHLLQHLVKDVSFDETDHVSHNMTNHSCFFCLLNCAIGWSKMFQNQSFRNVNIDKRNIFNRIPSRSGFTFDIYVRKWGRTKKRYIHSLDMLYSWSKITGSHEAIDAALNAMGYESDIAIAQLFLLNKKDDVIVKALNANCDEAACLYYLKGPQTVDPESIAEACCYAALKKKNDFLAMVLERTPYSDLVSSGSPSPMEVAAAYGNIEFVTSMEKTGVSESYQTLKDIPEAVPLLTKWIIGEARPGCEDWHTSLRNQESSPMSVADAVLVHSFDAKRKGVIEKHAEVTSVIPAHFLEKDLDVDLQSFTDALPELSDVQVRAVVLSKLVAGRYTCNIDMDSLWWTSANSISISCISRDSSEHPKMSVSGSLIRDRVKVSVTDGGVCVLTGDVPTMLSREAGDQQYINDVVATEMQDLIEQELNGLSVTIDVDWDSLNETTDPRAYSYVMAVLRGDTANNKLGGLQELINRCGSSLRCIERLCGQKASSSIQEMYSGLETITVRYTPTLSIRKTDAVFSSESSMVWCFTVKDWSLRYSCEHFPLFRMLNVSRIGYTCLTRGFSILTNKPDHSVPITDLRKTSTECMRTRQKRVTASIDWESFVGVGMTTKIEDFLRTSAVAELTKVAEDYVAMPWLLLSFDDVSLRVTRMKDRAGLWLKGRTLIICLQVYKKDVGTWETEDVDCGKFFHQMEEKQILEQIPTHGFSYPKGQNEFTWPKVPHIKESSSSKTLTSASVYLKEQLGLEIAVKTNDAEWLKIIHKEDKNAMTHPLHLIGRYYDRLAFETCYAFCNTVMMELQASNTCRYLRKGKFPAGGWSWVSRNELERVGRSRIVMVLKKEKDKKGNPLFCIMNVSEAKIQTLDDVIGFWQHVSFTKMIEDSSRDIHRVNLISISSKLMFVCDRAAIKAFLRRIPTSVCVKPKLDTWKSKSTVAGGEMVISSSQLMYLYGYFHQNQIVCHQKELLQFNLRSKFDHIAVVYDVWRAGLELGVHIVFDIEDFVRDSALEIVGYVMQLTLSDIAGIAKRLDDNKDAILATVARLGIIHVGLSQSQKEHTVGKVEGSRYSEIADISLLSETDLHINFKQTVLDPDTELKAITETLISAVCCSFEFQTPFEIADKLGNVLHDDVTVFSFHNRSNKESLLTAAVNSRGNFLKALQSVADHEGEGDSTYGLAKANLSKVVAFEVKEKPNRDCPGVSLSNDKLTYSVFKSDGNVASEKEMEGELITALTGTTVTKQDVEERYTHAYANKLNLFQRDDLFPDNESVLTVSSPRKVKKLLPKIERLKRPTATSKLAIQKATDRLFDFVEMGHTGNIENVLDVGADINAKNNDGCTPIIKAAGLRNYVLQTLLLSHGADVTKADKVGRTALHLESAHGDTESIKLFLAYGASVNAKDRNGRTPLHYAVNKKQRGAVDILVFCGADVDIADKGGNTSAYQCNNGRLLKLLQESKQTVFGIKNGYVFIEHRALEAESTYNLEKLGLTIKTPSSIGTGTVNFIGRRVRPEYSRSSLVPVDKELLMSDVFEYRLSGTRPDGYMILKIPVYDKPDMFEEVYMKTDKGIYSGKLHDIRFEEKTKQWFCYVKMDICSVNAFLLVTVPKVEKFTVTSEGGVFTSAVDNLVEIRIDKNTFSKPGNLTLEVIPKPAFEEEEFSAVLSLSHFYDINHSKGEQPQRDAHITMPIPQDYFGDGDLYVMLRHDEADYKEEDDCWEILEKNPAISNGRITVAVPHFSDLNLLEYKVAMKTAVISDKEVIRTNAKLLEKAKRRECSVVFMAMLRPKEDNSGCEAVVECTRNTKLRTRLLHWKTEGFKDQKPSYTSEFITFPKQEFQFNLGGNSQKVHDVVTKLQYHPKRDNYLTFPIRVKDEKKEKVGSVDIDRTKLDKEFEANPNYGTLARILVYLADFERMHKLGSVEDDDASPDAVAQEEAKAFEGFTDKNLLQQLAKGLKSEWDRVANLLSFTRSSLQKLKATEDLDDVQKKLKILTWWRDRRLHRSDHGVPELLIALQKSGRRDLVNMVITELKSWLAEKKERQDKFYSWLELALTDNNSQITGLLEPMSDAFLQALIGETGIVLELAGDIDVSRPEVETVLADPLAPTDEAKMLKVLQICREKQDTRGESFRTLAEGMTSYGMIEPRNWMLRTARDWRNNIELSDDPFPHAIDDYLMEAEKKYMKLSPARTSTHQEENSTSHEENSTRHGENSTSQEENSTDQMLFLPGGE